MYQLYLQKLRLEKTKYQHFIICIRQQSSNKANKQEFNRQENMTK